MKPVHIIDTIVLAISTGLQIGVVVGSLDSRWENPWFKPILCGLSVLRLHVPPVHVWVGSALETCSYMWMRRYRRWINDDSIYKSKIVTLTTDDCIFILTWSLPSCDGFYFFPSVRSGILVRSPCYLWTLNTGKDVSIMGPFTPILCFLMYFVSLIHAGLVSAVPTDAPDFLRRHLWNQKHELLLLEVNENRHQMSCHTNSSTSLSTLGGDGTHTPSHVPVSAIWDQKSVCLRTDGVAEYDTHKHTRTHKYTYFKWGPWEEMGSSRRGCLTQEQQRRIQTVLKHNVFHPQSPRAQASCLSFSVSVCKVPFVD